MRLTNVDANYSFGKIEEASIKVSVRKLYGPWDDGYALDKHSLHSTFTGYNEYGHATYDTVRTEAGECLYRLKYQHAHDQAKPLSDAVFEHIVPLLPQIGLVVPMPPSTARARQPVHEVADSLARRLNIQAFENIIMKSASASGRSLKNLATKEEKIAELSGRFSISDGIHGEGRWNALLLDDLFDSGASMEAATAALRTYRKIDRIFAVALTWK